MASLKKKNVVSKDDLKRLMKQSALQKNERKIDSPLAKYDSLGNLFCALCSSKVKNNLHWKAHVQSRTHKQNLEDLKVQAQKKQEATVALPSDLKRKRSSPTPPAAGSNSQAKKSKLPGDFFDNNVSASISKTPSSSLQLGGYGSSSDESDDDDEAANRAANSSGGQATKTPAPPPAAAASNSTGLPADFFDSGVVASKAKEDTEKEAEEEEDKSKSMADKLPEGFFDDPKQDAKVREIKYVDKDEEEWERFQRAIKEENIVSEQIQEEDEEEKQAERNVKEIDEHIYHWSKVEELHEQKDKVIATSKTGDQKEDQSSDSELDEKEYEEFMDWRCKKV